MDGTLAQIIRLIVACVITIALALGITNYIDLHKEVQRLTAENTSLKKVNKELKRKLNEIENTSTFE